MRQRFSPRIPLFALLALAAVAGHGRQQPAESAPGIDRQVGTWVEPCLRLRSGASLDRSILECLEPGTRLRVLGEISNWSQVRLLDGTEGWVDSGFLEDAPDAAATRPATAPPPASPQAAPAPTAEPPPAGDLRGQIAALEGQLQAMSELRAATEERLRRTVAAAEEAQVEAGRLSQRVQELEREKGAAGGDRAPQLEAELEAGRARIGELEQALAAAESQLLRAAELNAEQERRIEALDAAAAGGRASEAELRQALADAETRARQAEEGRQAQAKRLAELEAELPAIRRSETELRQALAEAETRARQAEEGRQTRAKRLAELEAELPAIRRSEAELRQALAEAEARAAAAEDSRRAQASRIAELDAELTAARRRETELAQRLAGLESRLEAADETHARHLRRIAELTDQLAAAPSRPAAAAAPARPEAAPSEPPAAPVQVREPIVAAPQPPPVAVREPLAMEPAAQAEDGEPQPAAPAADEAEAPPTEAAMDAVRAWAAAWSDQRVEDYLSFYAPGFLPAGGQSRDAWRAQRAERLTRPSYIRVTISALGAELQPDGTVRATFRQDYESDTYADSVTKVLTLAEQDGAWRILLERSEP